MNVHRLGIFMTHEYSLNFDWINSDNIYKQKYINFISKIKSKRPEIKRKSGYHRHHIKPRHYFSSKENIDNSTNNIVLLTLREHAIAHVFLAKATRHYKDYWALCRVLRDKTTKNQKSFKYLDKYARNPKISEETRQKMKDAWTKRKEKGLGEPWNKGISSEKTAEIAKKQWQTKKERRYRLSEEHKRKLSESVKKSKSKSNDIVEST